jgi:hypothetical protein
MSSNRIGLRILYAIGIIMSLVSLVMSFTGLPLTYDTEPLLAIGLLVVAVAGWVSLKG